jgi:hypothetical protein
MPDPITLRTDGPHSPETVRAAADQVAEMIRYLNYAAMSGSEGLESPADVYSLLGALYTATGRLPQLLGQLDRFLAAQAASGRLAADDGAPTGGLISSAGEALHNADCWAAGLTEALQRAQNAIAGLNVRRGTDD